MGAALWKRYLRAILSGPHTSRSACAAKAWSWNVLLKDKGESCKARRDLVRQRFNTLTRLDLRIWDLRGLATNIICSCGDQLRGDN